MDYDEFEPVGYGEVLKIFDRHQVPQNWAERLAQKGYNVVDSLRLPELNTGEHFGVGAIFEGPHGGKVWLGYYKHPDHQGSMILGGGSFVYVHPYKPENEQDERALAKDLSEVMEEDISRWFPFSGQAEDLYQYFKKHREPDQPVQGKNLASRLLDLLPSHK